MTLETGISYFANGWSHHFRRDMEDILDHGCTYIVHCFSETELVFARKRTQQFFRLTRISTPAAATGASLSASRCSV